MRKAVRIPKSKKASKRKEGSGKSIEENVMVFKWEEVFSSQHIAKQRFSDCKEDCVGVNRCLVLYMFVLRSCSVSHPVSFFLHRTNPI